MAEASAEIAAAIDRIQGHLTQLTVEIELLKRKVELEQQIDGGGDKPLPPPPPGVEAAHPTELVGSLVPLPLEVELGDLGVEVVKTMAIRGFEDFGSFALDPETEVRFFHPGRPGEGFRSVVQLSDLSHAPRLRAQIEMLDGMALVDGLSIAAPGAFDAVERAVTDSLGDYSGRFSNPIEILDLDD